MGRKPIHIQTFIIITTYSIRLYTQKFYECIYDFCSESPMKINQQIHPIHNALFYVIDHHMMGSYTCVQCMYEDHCHKLSKIYFHVLMCKKFIDMYFMSVLIMHCMCSTQYTTSNRIRRENYSSK